MAKKNMVHHSSTNDYYYYCSSAQGILQCSEFPLRQQAQKPTGVKNPMEDTGTT